MKKISAKLISLALAGSMLAIAAAACGKSAPATSDGIVIGGLAPLTGKVSQYGQATNNGIELAIDEINKAGGINGKQVKYIVKDEKGDAQEALNAYNQLKGEGIIALLGDVTSGPSIAVAQRAAKDRIPMLTATGTVADITLKGDNIFRMCFLDSDQGHIMGTYAAQKLGLKKAALLTNEGSDYSVGLAKAFKDSFSAAGGSVVAEETYTDDAVDFKTQLTKIKTAAPELLYVPDYYEKDILIVTQLKQVGLQIPIMGGDGWDGVLDVTKEKTEADGNIFTNHYATDDSNPKVGEFIKAYKAKYNEDPISFAALGYDSAKLLCQAIGEAGELKHDAVTKALQSVKYDGVTGDNITFDKNGDPLKPISILSIDGGQYTLKDKMVIEDRANSD